MKRESILHTRRPEHFLTVHVLRLTPHIFSLERAMGFEPTTASLEGWNSTTELRPPFSSSVLSSSSGCIRSLSTRRLPALCLMWWAGKDSNLGSRWQQIYSLPPLATWVPARNTLHATQQKNPKVLTIAFLFIRMMKKEKQAGPRTAPLPY